MTIVVGFASPDGLVLAGDSRTTYSAGHTHHRIMSDYAQKVFAVGGMGVATYGDAFIGTETIAGLMDQFIAGLQEPEKSDIDAFTSAIGDFFHDQFSRSPVGSGWDPNTRGYPLGFLIAGYDQTGIGHIREVLIPGPGLGVIDANTADGGAAWRGQTGVIARLIKGVDWQELARAKLPSDRIAKRTREKLEGLEYETLLPITVQDAIDFACFLVRTTIDMQRFSDGTHGHPHALADCGGPLLVLAVGRDGPQWVRSPRLSEPSRPGWAEGSHS